MPTTLSDIRSDLQFVLDANPTQTNSATVTDARLNSAINSAYAREVAYAKMHGSKKYFFAYTDDTWSAASTTLSLPSAATQQLVSIRDVTNGTPGTKISIGGPSGDALVYWLDKDTLRWTGDSGPGEDKTIRFFYYANAETLSGDTDEPTLIPVEMRELLVWSAAVWLREILDEESPASFRKFQKEYRDMYIKHVSRGRPYSDPEVTLEIEDEHERGYF